MRHNQHIIRPRAILAPPPRALPTPSLMPFLPNIPNQLIQPFCDLLRCLAAFASIAPDIPILAEAALLARLPDLGGGEAFVVAVVPFANEGGYGDAGGGADVGGGCRCRNLGGCFPGVLGFAA